MNNPQPRPLGTRIKKALPQYLAISPYFFFFFVFGAMPVVFTMALAFTNWSGLGDFDLIGFTNFKYLISDPLFY
ncbi:MAG: sugar ABC transporter permease, partial [Dermabacter sp.]|nr:sugar ABC transporter permease [Dermabacter sp.]